MSRSYWVEGELLVRLFRVISQSERLSPALIISLACRSSMWKLLVDCYHQASLSLLDMLGEHLTILFTLSPTTLAGFD